MDWPVTYARKIRFSDTDAQGIVFNGNYPIYIDDATTDFFDVIGIPWTEFTRTGYEMVLGRSEIDYRSAGNLGETLLTGARIARFGNTSVIFTIQTWDEATGRVVIDAKLVYVIVDAETFRPKPVPQFLIEAVEKAQGGPVERAAPKA